MSIVYARSTTIDAQPSFIDVGIKHMRDTVMPALADIDGCAGLSLLVDRSSGRCIVTTSWMDEDSLRASEGPVLQLRAGVAEVFHGTAAVARWDIAVLHRDHRSRRGACVRVSWVHVEPGHLERAVDVYKMVSLPAMEELEGFCSASLLVDPAAGRAVSSVTFDSAEAMNGNRKESETIRTSGIRESGARLLEVGEFELAIAHLHVPEMA
ncbi:hypothetical protein B2J88_02260 [Rhodococcus sp. SRB_17]|uniref:hypothetical protein n=1 Tax=Rhodococcus sp. OK302 TaxID=1882769 RepID=UPI000B93B9A4|nr:hypothetical protein [Rhodococcus sp. OK302]NMM83200.1 hypothetical protein [Rhodococcus sp. SRB_17]OYD70816.1 hypothetical protein BDB13_4457 [Rhodococcus sp. OK302]